MIQHTETIQDAEMREVVGRPPALPLPDWVTPDTPMRRFTLDEYHQLIQVGFFHPDERFELIEGLMVLMSPNYPSHAGCVEDLHDMLREHLGRTVAIRSQLPITVTAMQSEPEPDIVVARRTSYRKQHPAPEDVFLLIEISDSTLRRDRSVKIPLYAQAGIQDFWLVNLKDSQLEVYRQPVQFSSRKAKYQVKEIHRGGDIVAPLAFPDCQLAVADILGGEG
jgi:Uma2 family endonuclease